MAEAKKKTEEIVPLLNASPKAKKLMEVWPRVVELDLEGEEKPFFLVIEEGRAAVEASVEKAVDMVISGSAKAFMDVMAGKKDVTYPIAHGELKLAKEKIPDIIAFSRILRTMERRVKG
ncbi:SCP2 sterol-binding domain-containing protein [bacterium]|nr:SCP2 sterol-binding domain-containing protein [bacterium]